MKILVLHALLRRRFFNCLSVAKRFKKERFSFHSLARCLARVVPTRNFRPSGVLDYPEDRTPSYAKVAQQGSLMLLRTFVDREGCIDRALVTYSGR